MNKDKMEFSKIDNFVDTSGKLTKSSHILDN